MSSLREEYLGGFQLSNSIRDLGHGLVEERSSDGNGYVSSDMRIGDLQRSYESGTGTYRCLEQIDTFGGFMSKDLDAANSGQSYQVTPQTSLDIDQKWKEGMWSVIRPALSAKNILAQIGLKRRQLLKALKNWRAKPTFSGIAEMRRAQSRNYGKDSSTQVDQDSYLMGDYVIKRKIILSGVSKYDEPHIHLLKEGQLIDDVATYTITVTNDGNSALGTSVPAGYLPALVPGSSTPLFGQASSTRTTPTGR